MHVWKNVGNVYTKIMYLIIICFEDSWFTRRLVSFEGPPSLEIKAFSPLSNTKWLARKQPFESTSFRYKPNMI